MVLDHEINECCAEFLVCVMMNVRTLFHFAPDMEFVPVVTHVGYAKMALMKLADDAETAIRG